MTKYLDEFRRCIGEQRYFDAHEILEEVWFPRRFENCDEVKLLKGFINAAVSLELAKRGKYLSSKKVWDNYLKYKPYLNKIDSPYKKQYQATAIYIENLI